MLEWLQSIFRRLGELRLQDVAVTDWLPLLVILLLSVASSMTLFFLYAVFFERRATGSDVHRAFPVLGISITAIFVCLQYSLPMSLGLLGALSIVRFRMPLKEPEEIGFLMALIATSICSATLNFVMLALLLTLTFLLLVILRVVPRFARSRSAVASLVVTVPKEQTNATLEAVLESSREQGQPAALDGMSDVADQTTLTFSVFRGTARSLANLQQRLHERCAGAEVSLFVNQHRPLGD